MFLPLPLLALLAGAGVYAYTKRAGSSAGSSGAGGSGDLNTGALRTLNPEQRKAMDAAMTHYVLIAVPSPVPDCTGAAVGVGRLPNEGELVVDDKRMGALVAMGVLAGTEVYLDSAFVVDVSAGLTPATMTVLVADSKRCPKAVANARAKGWYLYASPMTAVG